MITAPLIDGRFTIATDEPHVKVAWRVSGRPPQPQSKFLDSGPQVDVKTQCPFSSWAWLCSAFDPVPSRVDTHPFVDLLGNIDARVVESRKGATAPRSRPTEIEGRQE